MSIGRLQPIQSSAVVWELTDRRARRFHIRYWGLSTTIEVLEILEIFFKGEVWTYGVAHNSFKSSYGLALATSGKRLLHVADV